MTLLGEKGLRQLASLNHARASRLRGAAGRDPRRRARQRQLLQRIHARASGRGAPGGARDGRSGACSAGYRSGRLYPGVEALENGLVVAVTETATDEDIAALEAALKEVVQ